MISTSLNHYRLTAKLGAGGMGEVYRATDTRLGREVAIKVLPAHVSRDPQSLARFEREAKALATLNHPNVAAIYGFEADRGTHFIVLELVEGETLAERLGRGPLPLKEALTVARQMAEAVQEAHEKGIVHRDLKPGNVKITPNGRVKVLDFGLAKLTVGTTCRSSSESRDAQQRVPTTAAVDASTIVGRGIDSTTPGAVMGTPAYMSPEQARGQEVDKRTDVWAFGCCLFECLSGKKPFRGQTASELIAELLKSEPDWSRLPTETPREVVTLLRRCLEKESARRLSSIGDIAITLEETTRTTASSSPTPASKLQSTPHPTASPTETSLKWRRQVMAGLLILIVGAGVFFWQRPGSDRHPQAGSGVMRTNAVPPPSAASIPDQRSIAVLPFVNMSADKDNEYFSDGLTEQLTTALSQVKSLHVKGRSSAFVFKGKNENLREIGKQLGVANILQGSVQKAGTQLRITAQLINVSTDENLWATNYDRDLTNIFAIQSDVAERVAEALRVALLPGEKAQLAKKPTESLEAYEFYLLGRQHSNKRTEAGYHKAIDYYKQAIEKDPHYALPYAGLADSYAFLGLGIFGTLAPKEAYPKARKAAEKAIELDEGLAEAHTSLALVHLLYDWDWENTEKEFLRALELNPNYPIALSWYGFDLDRMGRFEEGLLKVKRAKELDPLAGGINLNVAVHFYYARDYDQFIEQNLKMLELDPSLGIHHWGLGRAYVQKAMYQDAITEFKKGMALSNGSPRMKATLGHVLGISGRKADAQQILDELRQLSMQKYVSPDCFAFIYIGLGEKEQAFAWLERAVAERSPMLFWLKVDPMYDSLRTDPRFAAVLKKMGLDK